MDSGERDDDSKSSSEESDHQQVNGRSYECVFCKRGFTTAQALGGHMNIHRKDRARIIQPIVPSVSNKPGEDLEYVNSPSPSISSYPPHYSASLEAQTNYHMYFPASSSSSTRHPHAYHTNNSNIRNPRHSSLVVEDWRTNLSLRIGPTRMEDSEEEKIEDGKEDEVDLELRLGNGR